MGRETQVYRQAPEGGCSLGFLLLYLITCLYSFLSPEDIHIQDEIKMFLEQQSYLVAFGLHRDHATELKEQKAQVTL